MLNLKQPHIHTVLSVAMVIMLAFTPQQATFAATKTVTKVITAVGKDDAQASKKITKAARKQLGREAELVEGINCKPNPDSKKNKTAIQCTGT